MKIRMGVLLVVLLASGLLGLAQSATAAGPEPPSVTGTGTFAGLVERVAEELSNCGDVDPATAIQLITREGV